MGHGPANSATEAQGIVGVSMNLVWNLLELVLDQLNLNPNANHHLVSPLFCPWEMHLCFPVVSKQETWLHKYLAHTSPNAMKMVLTRANSAISAQVIAGVLTNAELNWLGLVLDQLSLNPNVKD
jgi:hypothetical protein